MESASCPCELSFVSVIRWLRGDGLSLLALVAQREEEVLALLERHASHRERALVLHLPSATSDSVTRGTSLRAAKARAPWHAGQDGQPRSPASSRPP
jgi:hypothetical protein